MPTAKKESSVKHPSKGILKILFKEILEQITPDDAKRLNEAYREGKGIGFLPSRAPAGTRAESALGRALHRGWNATGSVGECEELSTQ